MADSKYIPCTDKVFPELIKRIIEQYEGITASCDEGDPGGWTKYGICQEDINPATGDNFTEQGIKELTIDNAIDIYRETYWKVLGCAQMPKGIAIEVLDFGINAGDFVAIRKLQRLIYCQVIDGIWGAKTLNDLKYFLSKHSLKELVNDYALGREIYYRSLARNGMSRFLNGWLNRNNDVKDWALNNC
jgi:lysozyme family protein